MTASVPIRETGTEMLGMMVAGTLRRNTKITSTTSAIASNSSTAASDYRGADHARAVGDDLHMHRLRQARQELWQLLLDLIDRGDDVSSRLAHHIEHDRRHAVIPGALFDVLSGLGDPGDVAQEHRGAVLVGNDRAQIVLRVLDLVIVIDGVVEFRSVEIALGLAHIDVREQRAQIIDVESVARELLRVRLDAYRRHVASRWSDEAHPRHLGNLRGETIVGDVLELGEGHRF